jgi:FAD:protein FMN transferase
MRLTLVLLLSITHGFCQTPAKFYRSFSAMGCGFQVTVVANNANDADTFLSMAVNNIKRIEGLISSWDEKSQTSRINNAAGVQPVSVDPELFDLIKRSLAISRLTDGAFDITYASMDRIWKFDGSVSELPDPDRIKESVRKVGFQKVQLTDSVQSVFLPVKGMKIGFGAIGKGYAADHTMNLLKSNGVSAGIINASGDLRTWGEQPNAESWQIGVKNPLNKNKVFVLLPLTNQALVTSGNYEKFITIDGKRFAHIIDPRTGYPSSGLTSVTVIASSAELADALATAVFVMGKEIGLDFVNQLKDVECVLVQDDGAVFYSDHINAKELK